MNSQIEQFDEFKAKPLSTPNMTSNSQDGYTIVEGFSGIFNYGVVYNVGAVNYNNCHTYGVLQLPRPMVIMNFDESAVIGAAYVGYGSSIVFYLSGSVVYTHNYSVNAMRGTNTVLPSPILCDKIVVNSCGGSSWEGGGGGSAQETYRFNGLQL